jgi:hypothetical protein
MQINVREKKIEDGRFGFFGPTSVLFTPFTKIICGVLLVGLLGSLGVTTWKVFETKNLKIELLEVKNDNTHLNNELDICKFELDDTNIRIAEIQAASEKDMQIIREVNEELSKLTVEQKKEINRLKSLPAPEGCDGATEWLRDNLDIFTRQQ